MGLHFIVLLFPQFRRKLQLGTIPLVDSENYPLRLLTYLKQESRPANEATESNFGVDYFKSELRLSGSPTCGLLFSQTSMETALLSTVFSRTSRSSRLTGWYA